jgi:SAM-dependent methyltransferase
MKLFAAASFRTALRTGVMALLPDRWGDRLLTAKQALWWRTVGRHWHHQHFNRISNKKALNTALSRVRQDTGLRPLAILEFGCNAGNNLYTLRQDPATAGIAYCGIDINPKAIAFAKANYPSDSFHIGDHRWFISNANALGSFDLFIASHVLYYIDEKHTRLILESAQRVAAYILVADRMQRFSDSSGVRTGLFTHPFANICNDIGLEVLEMAPGDLYGYFLARTGRVAFSEKCHVSRARRTEDLRGSQH